MEPVLQIDELETTGYEALKDKLRDYHRVSVSPYTTQVYVFEVVQVEL
jgi:hypothetical protein